MNNTFIGTALGIAPAVIAEAHPHLSGFGFDSTGDQCITWMMEAGFRKAHLEKMPGPDSLVIAIE